MIRLSGMHRPFESSVILEGSKTFSCLVNVAIMFESSVILEGSKTTISLC